jgi:murein DD-endopeptidase MepM/ murein hydrolase activator NlpD
LRKANLISIFLLSILLGCNSSSTSPENPDNTPATPTEQQAKKLTYLDIDLEESWELDSFKIERNEIFTDLLSGYNLSYAEIHKSSVVFGEQLDVRKLREGVYCSSLSVPSDSSKHIKYFIYHESPFRKVVLDFTDSIRSYSYVPTVDTVQATIASRVDKTLYHSILDAGVSYELGLDLAQVFAWQVDFFKIDTGDYFKVIFDKLLIDGEMVGYGAIYAAEFRHKKDTFQAFTYLFKDKRQYYDADGNSLKRAFLKAPLKYSRISSRYTKRRYHPVLKRYKAHLGTDYAAPKGTPIMSVGDGVVIAAAYTRGNGRYVKVKHNATYTTQYLHMSKFAKGIRKGKRVSQGDVIGYVGSTGLATGPHLCFRFWQNGKQVDPYRVIVPPSDPLPDEEKTAYLEAIDVWKKELQITKL